MTRQRGPLDSVTAAVGEAAGALRRRREARRPYAKLYGEDGIARLLEPDSPQAQDLIAAADSMIDAVDTAPGGPSTP